MWSGFDPEFQRQLDNIRRMVALQRYTPTREWPLTFVQEHHVLFVVREWPNGEITAYATAEYSHLIREGE
ncbi:MAG: hypothetical protein ACREMQ_22365 [Longimicrobiales bacterium]